MRLTSGQVTAIAHAGNYSYFLMKGETRLALLEAYRCTERFETPGQPLTVRIGWSSATGWATSAPRRVSTTGPTFL